MPNLLPCQDCNPTPPCYPQHEHCANFWTQCDLNITRSVSRGQDGNGVLYSRVGFAATVSCRGSSIHLYPVSTNARTMLIDRTSGRDGTVLGFGNSVGGLLRHNNSLTSSGEVFLSDDNHPAGENVEVAFELTLTITGVHPSNGWDYCQGGSWHLLFCTGVGSLTLHGSWGTNAFATCVVAPCSDPSRSRTDTETFTFRDLGEEIDFTPHIKWCWSGTRLVSVVKEANTTGRRWQFGDPLLLSTIELAGTDNPFIDNSTLPQAGRYHAEFIVTFKGTDIDGPFTVRDRIQIDRTYLAGGNKEKDDKWLSFTVSRP